MSTQVYDIGDVARIEAWVTSSTGAIDGTVTLRYSTPSGTHNSATPTRSSKGHYYYDLAVTESGRYAYQWNSTGTVVASEPGAFAARPKGAM